VPILAAEPCGQLSQPSNAGARTAEPWKFTRLPTLFSIVPKAFTLGFEKNLQYGRMATLRAWWLWPLSVSCRLKLMKKHIFWIYLLSLITCLGPQGVLGEVLSPMRPNIIYILLDDAGYGDVGCYGQKTLLTPNIDRLAAEGMKFTRHYSGSTVCAPSRCVLMSGMHTGHSGIRGNGPSHLPDTDQNVARVLKNAGYHTACIGKYGLGHPAPLDDPEKKGFDEFFGYVGTAHAHNFYTDFVVRNGQRVALENAIIPGSEKKPDTGVAKADGRKQWVPQLIADDVQRYLTERAKTPEQRFYLQYSLNLPHANNEASSSSPLGHGMETPSYGAFASKDWPDVSKGFASAMKFIDDEVGKILAQLKKSGLEENTIILFSSDNGPHSEGGHDAEFFNSNADLNGIKRDLTDGGIRVPFIVRWPGKIKPGSVSEHVSGFQDFLPTAADLACGSLAAECDGISLLPTLLGNTSQQKQHLYLPWFFDEAGGKRAILQWPWKLIHLSTQPKKSELSNSLTVQLFNLGTDPAELTNLATQNPDKVKELEGFMKQAWREQR
jgi:arylsulfatase A-like enzyme